MLKVRKEYKKLLPRNFFRDNPFDDLSAQVIALVSITMFEDAQYQEHMWKAVEEKVTPEQLALLEQEKTEISELKTGEAVVKFIRRGFDLINGPMLSQKILTMQDEVIPLLLRRFLTSFQDSIADAAFCVLSSSNVNQAYIDQLIADYPKIRNPLRPEHGLSCVRPARAGGDGSPASA